MKRNPKKDDTEKENKYLQIIAEFDWFIKTNQILTLQNISKQQLNDVINDSENIHIDFIRESANKNSKIYVVLKSNYVQDRRISKQHQINLLVCAIYGNYCYVPIVIETDINFGSRNFPTYPQSNNYNYVKDNWISWNIIIFNRHKINNTKQISAFYIFDDVNYGVILSIIKNNFIKNFFCLINNLKFNFSNIELEELHDIIYNKFVTFE